MLQFLLLLLSYFVGSIMGALIFGGKELLGKGSGNLGALNLLRTTGSWGRAVAALLVDVGKAYGMLLLTDVLFPNNPILLALVAFFLVLGHIFPPWTGFRGGRGVSVWLGTLLYINPLAAVLFFLLQFVLYLFIGYISGAFITVAFFFPGIYYQLFGAPHPALLAVLIPVWMKYLDKFAGIVRGEVPRHYWSVGA